MSRYREFQIHIHAGIIANAYDVLDKATAVAFQAGKNTCGLGISTGGKEPIVKLYGYGKHSDAVRVYSALRNNGYTIAHTVGV